MQGKVQWATSTFLYLLDSFRPADILLTARALSRDPGVSESSDCSVVPEMQSPGAT